MRIGETAHAAGMTAKTLRFYEERGLLPTATRDASGYREYGLDALTRLDFIRRSRAAGLTLAQIQDILHVRDTGDTPCTHVRDLLASRLSDLDARIAELITLRTTVAGFYQEVAAADPTECDPEMICSYL